VVFHLQHDRLIPFAAESLIDALSQRVDLIVEMLVLVDDRPARRRDLNEGKLADPLGLQLEQSFDGEKSLDDALGVVQAVDTDPDQPIGSHRMTLADMHPAVRHRPLILQPARRPLDGNRVGVDRREAPAVGHRGAVAVDARLKDAIDAGQEMVSMLTGVEPDDAAAEQAFQNLLPPRADAVALAELGQGICQNMMMVAFGSFSRTIFGSSAKW